MRKIFAFLFLFGFLTSFAQEIYTRRDSLQGGLRPERTCFDVLRYDLSVRINPTAKSVIGYNDITFKVIDNTHKIQIDLFENMAIDSIVWKSQKLHYDREFAAVFISFPNILLKDSQHTIRFYYSGNPTIAKNAPWDGGFVFSKDGAGKDWIAVAVQGTGASLWYPCKDSQSDEPDNGATIKVAVPNGLMDVSNGRLTGSEDLHDGYTRWDWKVLNPINSYDITVNVADYVHFGENYKELDLNYYVLRENEARAKVQFAQVKPMLDCYQNKFGKYPFTDDGYKLVETPYLGMEHQSAVAYGNKYQNGYLGSDLSFSGIGLNFDYNIIHESGHEWFGNSITSRDIADMWIHEGFTMYAEAVFVECQYGYDKAMLYINGMKHNVRNDKPIISAYGVNKEGSVDMYYKGALFINTLRHVINDDAKWWAMLLKYSQTYRHQIIDTETVIAFFSRESSMNLQPIFDQYLRHTTIPFLELRITNKKLEYRWRADAANFSMPVDVKIKGRKIRLVPTTSWRKSAIHLNSIKDVDILKNAFFVNAVNLK